MHLLRTLLIISKSKAPQIQTVSIKLEIISYDYCETRLVSVTCVVKEFMIIGESLKTQVTVLVYHRIHYNCIRQGVRVVRFTNQH